MSSEWESGVIHGCRDKQTGALRALDSRLPTTCLQSETRLNWNQTGPPGPPGPSDAFTSTTSFVPLPNGDVLHFLLSTRMVVMRREFGHVVRRLLTGSEWGHFERNLLDSGWLDDPLSPRTALLLCWLRHLAGNLTKSSRYNRNSLWIKANVDPVLATF